MGMMAEFKAFAMRGSVMDLAVGVIIGGAFGKIVDSLVGDVIMPLISALLGGKFDFSSLLIPLAHVPESVPRTADALREAGIPVFAYGNFITIVINFVLLAFVIFMLVKAMNHWQTPAAPEEPAPAETPPTEVLLTEIRDLLAKK